MKKSGLRTFSYDDKLMQRAANPRTGLIAPFVQFDGTEDDHPTDYLSSRQAAAPGFFIETRGEEGDRNAHNASWDSVDGPSAPPNYLVRNGQRVSPFILGQRIDPILRNVMWRNATTSENMDVRQKTFPNRLPNLGLGSHDINGPAYPQRNPQNELQPTVRGPRPAMKRPNKIPRKEVGSSVASNNSSDLNLDYGTKDPQISFPQPDQGAGGNAVRDWVEDPAQDRLPESTTQRIPRSQNGVSRDGLTAGTNHRSNQKSQKGPGPSGTTLPLNQCLPLVHLRHPSHFTNLEHVIRDREGRRLPPSLRSGSQKRRALEQAAVMGPIAAAPPMRQRPRMQRQENHATMLRGREERRDHDNYGWSTAESPPSRFTDSPQKRTGAAGQRSSDLGRDYRLAKVDEAVTEAREVRMTVAQEWSEAEPSKNPTLKVETFQESTAPLQSRDVGGATIRDSTHATEIRIAHDCITSDKDLATAEEKEQAESQQDSKTETEETGACKSEKSQIDIDVRQSRADSRHVGAEEALTKASSPRPLSGFSQLQALNELLQTSRGDWSTRSEKPSRVHWFVGLVGCHVASTLVRAMIAAQILGDSEARVRDYVTALKDIVLALFYLLAILHILNVTRHLIAAVSTILFYAWHPFQAMMLLVRWFVGT